MSRANRTIFFLIVATVFLTTLAYGTVHQPLIAVFYLAVLVMVLLWAADSVFTGVARFSTNSLQLPLFLLGVYALIQIIPFGTISEPDGIAQIPRVISLDPFATQVTALHIFFLSAFFFIAVIYLDGEERIRRTVTMLTIFGFLYSFYAILQSILSPDLIYGIYNPAGSPFGSFVNRNDYAAIIEMTAALPLGIIFCGAVNKDKRLIYAVAIVLMVSSLLLSGSRGGLVAFCFEVILLIVLTGRSKGRTNFYQKAALSILLVIAAVGGAIFVGGDTSLSRFSDAVEQNNLSSSRAEIWDVTVKVIIDHLPFGAGLGAFGAAYTDRDPSGGYFRVEQAHNDYLQILADAGIVGFVLGLLFLGLFLREGIRNVRTANRFRRGVAVGTFAGCSGILVHSLFDFVIHITAVSVMFIVCLALLIASGRKYDDDISEFGDELSNRRLADVTSIESRVRGQGNVVRG